MSRHNEPATKEDLDQVTKRFDTKLDQVTKRFDKKIDDGIEEIAQITSKAINYEINQLRQEMATKEDLRAFATKEDLKAFATKEDLKKLEIQVQSLDSNMQQLTKTTERILTIIETQESRWREAGDIHARLTRLEKRAFAA